MKKALSLFLVVLMLVGMLPMVALNANAAAGDYVKVTEAPADWSGTYLIVYEAGNVAFNGGLTTLDAASNTVAVTISNDVIAASDALKAATFTIDANGYVKSASGYYIGQTSNANGLKSSQTTTYTNTISINADGSVNFVSGGAYLRYNADNGQTRFRYYKSSTYTNQKAIHLYKLEEAAGGGCEHDYVEEVTSAASCTGTGEKTHTCSKCGDSYTTTIAALGHTWGDWTETTAPTCTEAGAKERSCSVCGTTESDVIAAAGHTFENGTCSVCGVAAPSAIASQITTADEFVSGEYVMVVSSGYAMGTFDSTTSWVLAVEPVIVDGSVRDAANGVWTLTVDGSSVKIVDANGVSIAPKGGNNNGIKSADYSWAWTCNEDGTFTFKGVDSDTVYLASNTSTNTSGGGFNKFRGYKTTTVEGALETYLANFSLYKLIDAGEETCAHENTTTETVAATCTTAGSTTVVCDDCGETVSTEEIAALGHSFVDGTCSVCGAKQTPDVCLEHTFNGTTCTVCGYVCTHENMADGTCTDCGFEGEIDTPDETEPTSSSATIDFSTTEQRVSQSTTSQVWSNGGATMTNNKDASTSNIIDSSNPVRLYKNSTVIVAFPGMTKIEFTCNTADYATALADSIDDSNATVSKSNTLVTVVLTEAVDEFTVVLSGGQVRVDTITVYAENTDCAHEWGEWVVTTAPTCTTAGEQSRTCTLCGDTTTQTISATGHSYDVNGNCTSCGMTPAAVVNALYALEAGASLPGQYTLTGKIISVDEAYSSSYKNITVTIVVGDMTEKPVMCYRLSGEGADVIQVNYTITVTGALKNHNGTYEFAAGCTLDSYAEPECEHAETTTTTVDATCSLSGSVTVTCNACGIIVSSSTIDPIAHTLENGVCTVCSMTTEPVAGATYKWAIAQDNLGKIIYFAGDMDGHYGKTTESFDEAVDVVLEEAEGGYYISFTNAEGVKKYINVVVSGTYRNFTIADEAATVYTWNAEYNTLQTDVEGTTCYIGTYSNYKTFSVSSIDKITTSFPSHFYVCECKHENTTTTTVDATCETAGSKTVTCDACDEIISTEEIPALGHNFENGTCTVCGEKDPNAGPEVDPNLKLGGIALAFADYISVQPYLLKADMSAYESYYLELTYSEYGADPVTEVMELFGTTSKNLVYELMVLPRSMTAEIALTVYVVKDGVTYRSETVITSVETLANDMIVKFYQENKLSRCKILVDMLNYGAAVQTRYVSANTDLPTVVEGYEHLGTADTPVLEDNTAMTGDGFAAYKIALGLGSKVEFQFAFTANDLNENYELRYEIDGGETGTVPYSEFVTSGQRLVAIFALKPRHFRSELKVAMYDKTTNEPVSVVYTTTVEDKAATLLGGNNEAVAIAMMKYGDAVIAHYAS